MLKTNNITELYSKADNFFLFFNRDMVEAKEKEIRKRGKLAKTVRTRGKWTVFEFKKII
jgi:23S rRNA maturation mini-RNase III